MRRASLGILGIIALLPACVHREPKYFVTDRAIDVDVGPAICIAIDPTDPHGVWWWQPAGADCERRSTGPDVFRAGDPVVARGPREDTSVAFTMQMHGNPSSVRVTLVLGDRQLRRPDRGPGMPVHGRADLAIPWAPPA